MHNGRLGAALGSWRALVCANIAVRRDEARKDALLHKVVCKMMRRAQARAFQRWGACVAELRALQVRN